MIEDARKKSKRHNRLKVATAIDCSKEDCVDACADQAAAKQEAVGHSRENGPWMVL